MRIRENVRNELHYYSDQLKLKLEAMRFVPATVVAAPSGYGKTTAIRDFCKTLSPRVRLSIGSLPWMKSPPRVFGDSAVRLRK